MTISVCLAVAATAAAWAAGLDDPDWPCVQRRVDSMSLGLMWPHSIPDRPFAIDPRIRDLVEALALRRTSLEEAGERIRGFTGRVQVDTALFGQVFSSVFARLDADRRRLVEGIVRYAREQQNLSDKIDVAREEMERLSRMEEPDFDRMDKLEEQLDWDQRIFRDRDQALTYLCETPTIIEKRAYALAKLLERALP